MSFPLPPNEAERLRALHELRVLEAPEVTALDMLCGIARERFGTSVAFVSLLDRDTQVFKGRCGLDLDGTSRDIAFCTHTILEDEIFVVEDASGDPRFAENPLVTGAPFLRFYAGAPLILRSGIRVGALCVMDAAPRRFSRQDREALARMACLAVNHVREHGSLVRAKEHLETAERTQVQIARTEDLADVGIWDWDILSGRLQWSEGSYRLLGLKSGSIQPSLELFLSFVHSEDRPWVAERCQASVAAGQPFIAKYRARHADGRFRVFESRGDVIKDDVGRIVRLVGGVQDVSERESFVASLKANEDRWKMALEAGQMITFEVDPMTLQVIVSDHGHEITGRQRGSLDDFLALVIPQDRARVRAIIETALQDSTSYQTEFRFRNADGEVRWLSQAGRLIERPDGSRCLAGVCFDVTVRKELELAREQSEQRFRDFAEISSDWLWEIDETFRLRWCSGTDTPWYCPKEQAVGRTLWDIVGADASEPPWREHIEQLQALRPFRDLAYTMKSACGETRYIVASGRPFFALDGRLLGYRGTASDVSERKQLELQLQCATKMEAIGQLTGGIAHDFNNLLTIIVGNSELLRDEIAKSDHLELINLVLGAAGRGANLVQRLLSYARRQPLQPSATSVNAIIDNMAGLLRRTLGEDIELRTSFSNNLSSAFVDATLLEATILNLAVNARDAMPRGGALSISTAEVSVDTRSSELAPGRYIRVVVADSGIGMNADVLSRAFDPFFTTKAAGKGNGLGLSMAYGFARQSGGHLTIESEVGKGTVLRLLLPATDAAVQPRAQTADKGPLGTGERILVVEDEPDLRLFAVGQLRKLGYSVEEAAHGPAALRLLRNRDDFDLLFSDIVLPNGMDGLQLAQEAKAIHPKIGIVLTTGYSDKAQPSEDTPILPKPYRRQELAAAIRAGLQSRSEMKVASV
jgi:PAS domain S-box-containing protein